VFYLDAEWDQIRRQIETGAVETEACVLVLGVTFDEIGMEAATRWRLPDMIRAGMGEFNAHDTEQPRQVQWLRAITNYSTAVADVLTTQNLPEWQREARIGELAQEYSRVLNTDPEVLLEMSVALAREEGGDGVMAEIVELRANADAIAREALNPEARIAAGVEDLRSLPDGSPLAPALALASETVLAGLGFARTVMFVKHSNGTFKARLGLGPKIDAALPKLSFSTAFEPDVFHLAIANSVGIFIENARDPKMVARLPEWFRRSFDDAQSFVLLPIVDETQQTVALLYGDWSQTPEPRPESRRISQKEMGALNELARELGRFFVQGQMQEMETM
jgi:hypothetical protein